MSAAKSSWWTNPRSIGHWKKRAAAAARWMLPATTILDIGCGDMTLERLLPPGCRYIPSDVVKRDDRTVVCDLNKDQLPPMFVTYAVVLGVMEHLVNPYNCIKELEKLACPVIISYHFDRWDSRWAKRLTRAEFEKMFGRYRITQRQTVSLGQELMYLQRADDGSNLD
jgi:hypothetical protein